MVKENSSITCELCFILKIVENVIQLIQFINIFLLEHNPCCLDTKDKFSSGKLELEKKISELCLSQFSLKPPPVLGANCKGEYRSKIISLLSCSCKSKHKIPQVNTEKKASQRLQLGNRRGMQTHCHFGASGHWLREKLGPLMISLCSTPRLNVEL